VVQINFQGGKSNFQGGKAISMAVKSISTVVKINIQGGEDQFPQWKKSIFSPVTRANFRAGYACTGNTLI